MSFCNQSGATLQYYFCFENADEIEVTLKNDNFDLPHKDFLEHCHLELIVYQLLNRNQNKGIYDGLGDGALYPRYSNQESIKISGKNLYVDNSLNIRTTLPKSLENISHRIASIQARVINKNTCVSSSALILRSDGKFIP